MKSIWKTRRAALALAFCVALMTAAAPTRAGTPWRIDWWTVDGGGEILTSGGSWELSGTVGQWDATAGTVASAGPWELSSGFWALSASRSDRLFSDGFE